jgi:hypothetical protein
MCICIMRALCVCVCVCLCVCVCFCAWVYVMRHVWGQNCTCVLDSIVKVYHSVNTIANGESEHEHNTGSINHFHSNNNTSPLLAPRRWALPTALVALEPAAPAAALTGGRVGRVGGGLAAWRSVFVGCLVCCVSCAFVRLIPRTLVPSC